MSPPTQILSGAPATMLSSECKHSHTQVRLPTQQWPHPINAIASFFDGAQPPCHWPNTGDWDHRWAQPPSLPSSMPLKQPRCRSPLALIKQHQTSSLLLIPSTLPYQTALSVEGASSSHPVLPCWMMLYLPLPPLAFQTTWTDLPLPLPLNKWHRASSPSLTPSTLPYHSTLSIEDTSPGTYHPQCWALRTFPLAHTTSPLFCHIALQAHYSLYH